MQLLTLKALAKEISLQSYYSSNVEFLPQKQVEGIFNINYKYDKGKYEASMRNKETNIDSDKPIWYVTRSDRNGSYLQLLTVQESRLNVHQLSIFDRVVDIWEKIK